MSYAHKAVEKAQRDCEDLARQYNVPRSAVIWRGGNKYIVIKDGETIYI